MRKPSAEKKEVIARCALDIFKEKGYVHTPVRDIIDASGYGTSTFYRYFKNKEDCLNFLLETFLQQVIEEVKSYYNREEDLYRRFIETKRVILRQFINDPSLTEVYCRVAGISERIDATLSGFDSNFTRFIKKNIQYGIEKGLFREIPVEPVTLSILGTIRFALYKWIVLKEISAREMEKQVISFHESLSKGIVLEPENKR